MAAGYRVDPGQLGALAKGLHGAVDAMSAARRALATASDKQTGEASLDRACGEFQDKWGYGLKQLATTTGALADGLHTTATAYRAVEDQVSGSLGATGRSTGAAGGGT
ncbi:type VII secretion target [Streptacidiphilus sp. EB129]|uniref:type VII secretion target n=1 Tax=Streptacidiphilus sp. EB129 TaxID=3156262 RepID=UPI003518D26B